MTQPDEDVPDIHVHVHIHRSADETRFTALEAQIVTIAEDLAALRATVVEFNEDIAAKVAALEAAQGEFTPEGRAAFDELKAAVEAGVSFVGDADADGNPLPPPP